MNKFVIGTAIDLVATFTNRAGEPADPDTVEFQVKRPESDLETYTFSDGDVDREGVGVYVLTLVVDEPKVWRWYVLGTGAVQRAERSEFIGLPALMA